MHTTKMSTDGMHRTSSDGKALVLAGGGIVSSTWIMGLVTGLADGGIDLRDADLFIGTSSGARVALQLAIGAPLEEAFARQLAAARRMGAPRAGGGEGGPLQRELARAREKGGDRAEILRRYGEIALAMGGADRRALVASQLPTSEWPERDVRMIALNAETGVRRAFDRASGIALADAVTATTASFGSAPVWFEGAPYIDGGYYSGDNADLAQGFRRVLVLTLVAPPWAMRLVPLEEGVDRLRAAGAEVDVIQPDETAAAAIAALGDAAHPGSLETVAHAGRAQGASVAAERGRGWW